MGRDLYDVLGESVVREMSGEAVGFDWGGLLSGTANVVEKGVESHESDVQKGKVASDMAHAVALSISADVAWANAEANYELASFDATSKAAAEVMRDSAEHDAQAAASVLDSAGTDKRCRAAKDALKNAALASTKMPKDITAKARMHAWQKVSSACGSVSPTASADDKGKIERKDEGGGSFLTQMRWGLPTWSWGLIGAGGLTALVLIVRSFRSKS